MFPARIETFFTEIQCENEGGLNLTMILKHVKQWAEKFTSLP